MSRGPEHADKRWTTERRHEMPIESLNGNTSAEQESNATRSATAWRRARTQIAVILAIGSCVIALLWIIMLVVIQNERRAAVDHARDEANNLSAALRWEVGQTLDAVAHAMDSVADRMRSSQGTFDIHDWAKEIPFLAAASAQGGIISPDGIMLSSTLEPHAPWVDLSDREYFRVHLDRRFKGMFVSEPVVERLSGQTVVPVSRRVEAADGTFLGVVVFSLAPAQLTRLHESIDLGARGKMIVVGTEDRVIRARFGTGSASGAVGTGKHVPPPPPNAAGDSGNARYYARESVIDHVQRLYSLREVVGYPLSVTVALDLTEVLAAPAAHARLITATGIIATLMLMGLMLLLVVEIRRRTDREVKLGDERARLAIEIEQGKLAQKRLRSSEARLRDFAEMASDWFWEQDAELRFVAINADRPPLAAEKQALLGKRRWEVNDTDDEPDKWASHKHDLLARKPFRDFRFRRTGADGSVRYVSINGVPVFDDRGKFAGYRGTGRDVTEHVLAEEQLRHSKEQAEGANRSKSTFLANMSHELRTPLHAIIGFAELLQARKAGPIKPIYAEWAGDILAAGRHLLDLINDVLELSRIEAGRYDLVEETVDFGAVARACLPMVRHDAEKNQLRIECDIMDGEIVVLADRRSIKQVMLNLLTNAVKFTPPGGSVVIEAEPTAAGGISLVVRDTGIGIDPAMVPNLCKPFVQADASTSRRYGGTGLGLAISSKLIELQGGTLDVQSVPGQGTTVRVTFHGDRILTVREMRAEPV